MTLQQCFLIGSTPPLDGEALGVMMGRWVLLVYSLRSVEGMQMFWVNILDKVREILWPISFDFCVAHLRKMILCRILCWWEVNWILLIPPVCLPRISGVNLAFAQVGCYCANCQVPRILSAAWLGWVQCLSPEAPQKWEMLMGSSNFYYDREWVSIWIWHLTTKWTCVKSRLVGGQINISPHGFPETTCCSSQVSLITLIIWTLRAFLGVNAWLAERVYNLAP